MILFENCTIILLLLFNNLLLIMVPPTKVMTEDDTNATPKRLNADLKFPRIILINKKITKILMLNKR